MNNAVNILAPLVAVAVLVALKNASKLIEPKIEDLMLIARKYLTLAKEKLKKEDDCFSILTANEGAGTLIIPNWMIEIADINGNTVPTLYMFQASTLDTEGCIIGTAPDAGIRIVCQGSLFVGKRHASLVLNSGSLMVIDMASRNGIFNANHERIDTIAIHHNTTVFLSDLIKLTFIRVTAMEFYSLLNSDRKIELL